jgi:hypothetical protein
VARRQWWCGHDFSVLATKWAFILKGQIMNLKTGFWLLPLLWVSSAQAVATPEPIKVWVESLAKRFAPCFTALGAQGYFPVAAREPGEQGMVAEVSLPGSPAVSDGYQYVLRFHGPSNAVFVVQSGGIAGARLVYGPLPIDTQCPSAR